MFGFRQKVENISIDELVTKEPKKIIDVREQMEFEQAHIPNAHNIPMFGLLMNAAHFLAKDEMYYIVCQTGNRSHQVCVTLTKQGYTVVNVLGGTSAYIEKYGKK